MGCQAAGNILLIGICGSLCSYQHYDTFKADAIISATLKVNLSI